MLIFSFIKKLLIIILFIIILCLIIFFVIGFFRKGPTTQEYIKEEIDIDISYCELEKDDDNHQGFLGDGGRLIVFDCHKNKEKVVEQIKEWETLPLKGNIKAMMYGGYDYNRVYRSSSIAKDYHIPELKNGYYYFIDRHSEAKDKHSDLNIFGRGSHNFTLVLYDTDEDILYYFEDDT